MGDVKEKSDKKSTQKALDPVEVVENRKLKEIDSKILKGENPEREAFERQRIERNMDTEVLNRSEMRYGQWISPERLAAARKEVAAFQEKGDFKSELTRRDPVASPEEIERTVGYQTGNEVRVERNTEAPGTLVHERFHSLSHPEAKNVLGKHLYEGMTEELALRESDYQSKLYKWERLDDGSYRIEPPPEYYPENRASLNIIRAKVPEAPLMEAYFQGNDKRLEAFIDHDCGDGTWKEAKELLETAEKSNDREALEKARKLLRG
ncbi:MAG: hypothetical protein ABIN18_01110 [Pseudomonadota bacterium]